MFAMFMAIYAETWQNVVEISQIIQKMLPHAEHLMKVAKIIDKS